jgi:site-specific DNA recombinase
MVAVLTHNRSKAGNRIKYLGAGKYRCGLCGGPLRSGWTVSGHRKWRVYKCAGHVSLSADPIDEYLSAELSWLYAAEDLSDLAACHPADPTRTGHGHD